MLNAIRKGVGSWFVKAFLGVLILSFAVWGIGDIFRVQPDSAVVEVGDIEISGSDFLSDFNRNMRRLQTSFGTGIDRDQARALGLVEQTIQQMVGRALLDQAAYELEMTVDQDVITQEIITNPAFQNEFGQFDAFRFQQALRESGFSEPGFIAANQRDIVRRQLFTTLTAGIRPPTSMVDAFYRYDQEKRSLAVLTIANDSITDIPEPDDGALVTYHSEHALQFTAPEFRGLTFVTLSPADLTDEVAVSEADIDEAYQDRIDSYTVPELREVEQILISDEDVANAAADRLRQGEDFFAVAQDAAGLDEEAVKLGEVMRVDLPTETAGAVFALAQDTVSDPVQSPFGWHLFRVTKITAGSTKPLEEVREELTQQIKLDRATDAIFDLSNEIDDALAGGANIEEVARSFNLPLGQVAATDANGRGRDGEPLAALPRVREFLPTAFDTNEGEEPVLNESDDGSYFLLRVDGITPPALRPLDEVRDDVVAAWRREAQGEAAIAKAAEVLERARGGERLETLSIELGYPLKITSALTRNALGGDAEISADLVSEAFTLDVGGVAVGDTRANTGQALVELIEVKAANASDDEEALNQMRQSVLASIAEDVLAQYQAALRDAYPVEVHQRVINAIFDQPTYPQHSY